LSLNSYKFIDGLDVPLAKHPILVLIRITIRI